MVLGKQPVGETPRSNVNENEEPSPYEVDNSPPVFAPLPPEARGKSPLVQKETKVGGGAITDEPPLRASPKAARVFPHLSCSTVKTNLLAEDGSVGIGSEGHHLHPKEEERKELLVRFHFLSSNPMTS